MYAIHDLLRQGLKFFTENVGPGTLVTVVHTQGSCYQKAGAQLFLSQQGLIYGLVSGGCVEQAIIDDAKALPPEQKAAVSIYDTSGSDDLDFGYGMGCGGKIWVLFEAMGEFTSLERAVRGWTRSAHPEAVVIASTAQAEVGRRIPLTAEFWAEASPEQAALLPLRPEWSAHPAPSRHVLCQWNGCDVTCAIYYRPVRVNMTIFGAGPQSWPVAQMAGILGWDVSVYDYRQGLIDDFPAALGNKFLVSRDAREIGALSSSALKAAVVMTHNFGFDLSLTKILLAQDWCYIGLLGSGKRFINIGKALHQDLEAKIDHKALNVLRGPAGLEMGGQDPSSIALSIICEIQAVIYDKAPVVRPSLLAEFNV